jgi:hypothetical protein
MNHEKSVLYVAGEMLSVAEPFLEQQMHPTTIITAYRQALDDIISITRDKIRYMYVAVTVCVFCRPSPEEYTCACKCSSLTRKGPLYSRTSE